MQVSSKVASFSARRAVPIEETASPGTCEILVRGRWTPVSLEKALALHPDRLKRCCECLGAMQIMPDTASGRPARFVHRQAHGGCSCADGFAGKRIRHPKPLT